MIVDSLGVGRLCSAFFNRAEINYQVAVWSEYLWGMGLFGGVCDHARAGLVGCRRRCHRLWGGFGCSDSRFACGFS